jgi:hypothetical protein
VGRSAVSRSENENVRRVLRLAREMIALADEGDRDRKDISCGILYGILRDMAYQLRRMAEKEREIHRSEGIWD